MSAAGPATGGVGEPSPRTVVITGASDGIGAAAARMLSAQGDRLVLVGRSPAKTRAVAAELGADHHVADFSALAQVRELAATLRERYPRIDVLANNAGGVMGARQETGDGLELTLQVNHLAPFLLTTLLLDTLVASRATVINTSSAANTLLARFDLADLGGERHYSPSTAYGNAKLANILFTQELHRRYGAAGIATAAFHPGVVGSNFSAEATGLLRLAYHSPLRRYMLTPERGADTLLWLATTTPGQDWTSGEYYAKRRPAKVNAVAQDPAVARELWERSEALLGLPAAEAS